METRGWVQLPGTLIGRTATYKHHCGALKRLVPGSFAKLKCKICDKKRHKYKREAPRYKWRTRDDVPQELYNRLRLKICNILSRYYNPSKPYYGRVEVHEPWIRDRDAFLDYLLTLPGHDDPKLTLDRKNNDGHYEPGNVRFVSQLVQNHNRSCLTTTLRESVTKKLGQLSEADLELLLNKIERSRS